jgi:hypothetical protein
MGQALQLVKQSTIPADVAAVRDRVAGWRSARVKQCAMPEELWEAAVSLVARHGLYRVARAVRVDYGALKTRCDLRSAGESGVFVEVEASRLLSPPAAARDPRLEGAGTVVEMYRPDGARLVVRLAAQDGLDVVGLAGAFWGTGR